MSKDQEKSKEVPFPCLRCSKNVLNNCKGIRCFTCKQWVHVECELTIDDDDYTYYKKLDAKKIPIGWYCQACSNVSVKFENMFTKLQSAVTEVGLKQKATDESVSKLEARQTVAETVQDNIVKRVGN